MSWRSARDFAPIGISRKTCQSRKGTRSEKVKPLLRYILPAAGIVGLVLLVSWWQSSSASAEIRALREQSREQARKFEEVERERTRQKEHDARLEEIRQRELAALTRELSALQADRARLREELTRERERVLQQVAAISTTGDSELAASVQEMARETHADSDYRHVQGEWFEADRAATESIAQAFFERNGLKSEVANLTAQNEAGEREGVNLGQQLTLERSRAVACLAREERCEGQISSLQEQLQIQGQINTALSRKAFWDRWKYRGGLAVAFGTGFAAGRLTANP